MTNNNINNDSHRRVAVITGSSRGIGKSIAMEFALNGYSIVANARDEKELTTAVQEIQNKIQDNGRISYIVGDISDERTCISLIQEAVTKFGRIDVLINNAGISGPSAKTTEISSNDWDYVIDVNLKSAFLCSREAIKQMLSQGRELGTNHHNDYSIINISSVHESIPMPDAAPYAASKGGMEMLTKNIALEVADKGIRVNGIAPGAIATDMNKEMLEDEQKRKEEEQKIPMKRIGLPHEIASVALFLASSNASYIAGTTIYADGGLTLSQ
jgi:glucose 1-dehydrogenase